MSVAGSPNAWQRTLHGPHTGLRYAATKVILRHKGPKQAFRYALCGLGDQVQRDANGVSIAPRGCGHKLCPRCAKKRGTPMVRRIFRWLARAPHGDIFTMCCTQKVVKGEPLAAARDRFVKRLTPYLAKLKREGMTAGMLTTHIVWSRRSEGWHYHVHLVVQADHNVLSTASLINWWADTGGAEAKNVSSMQSRLIVVAGDPIESLEHDDGQPLFWKESNVTVARSIQYPVRDMLQGVTMFRLGGDPGAIESKMEELYAASTQWKMRRTLGQWRKVPPLAAPAPVKDVEGADDGDAGASSAPCKKSLVGTVSKIWKSARAGNFAARMILKELEASIANSTEFSKRFILFCRSGIERQPTG